MRMMEYDSYYNASYKAYPLRNAQVKQLSKCLFCHEIVNHTHSWAVQPKSMRTMHWTCMAKHIRLKKRGKKGYLVRYKP